MNRAYNFYAGPSTLPVEVLKRLQKDLPDYEGTGLSLIETSHRSPEYDKVHTRALALIRDLLRVPDSHDILLLQGGATLQFGMVPMNIAEEGKPIDFVLNGAWGKKAKADAEQFGDVRVVSKSPRPEGLDMNSDASYMHITSNETIGGEQWQHFPDAGSVPLVADMSSDIMSRSLPVSSFGIIYAGAQKNLGPAGVTVVIIRKDLVDRSSRPLPAYLKYRTHAEKDSLYNTPPVFAIWALSLVLEWIAAKGGVEKIESINEKKASMVYEAIDGSDGYYSCPVDTDIRSRMNVVFRLPNEDLEKQFVAEAKARDMIGLKGHRSVGGCRASLYNALPVEAAEQLTDFMKEFRAAHPA